jgi:hypothetical protein
MIVDNMVVWLHGLGQNTARVSWFRRRLWLIPLVLYSKTQPTVGPEKAAATGTSACEDTVASLEDTASTSTTFGHCTINSDSKFEQPSHVAGLQLPAGKSANDVHLLELLRDPRLTAGLTGRPDTGSNEVGSLAVRIARFLSSCCDDATCSGICICSNSKEIKSERRRSMVLPVKKSGLLPVISAAPGQGSGVRSTPTNVSVEDARERGDGESKTVVLLANDKSGGSSVRRSSRRHSSVTQARSERLNGTASTPQGSPIKLKPLALAPLESNVERSPSLLPKPLVSIMIDLKTPILLPIPGVQAPSQPQFQFSKSLTTSVDKDCEEEIDRSHKHQLKPIQVVRALSGRNLNSQSLRQPQETGANFRYSSSLGSSQSYYLQPMRISASLSRSVSLDPVEEDKDAEDTRNCNSDEASQAESDPENIGECRSEFRHQFSSLAQAFSYHVVFTVCRSTRHSRVNSFADSSFWKPFKIEPIAPTFCALLHVLLVFSTFVCIRDGGFRS